MMKIRILLIITLSLGLGGYAQNFNIKEYGAVSDTLVNSQQSIQAAIDACFKAGGGKVVFPPGNYKTGTIVLKSNVILDVYAGATLYASTDSKDYANDFFVYKKNDSGKKGDGATPVLIYAKNAQNIGITGKGIIHGRARRAYEDLKEVDGFIAKETENARKSGIEMKMYYKVAPYVCMLFLESSSNISITETQFIESTDWTLHFKWCNNVFINNIYVQSSLEKGVNADGIDIDGCKNVVISNSIIETGDDAIVLKSTSTFNKYESCENITVSNCVLVSTSTALKLGTESFGDFKHIIFSNCVIRNTNRGLSIVIRDGANVDNVLFSNITIETNRKHFNWWGSGDAIWLVVKKRFPHSKVGSIINVTFDNIIAVGQGTSKIESIEKGTIKNINFNNVSLSLEAEDLADKRADNILYFDKVENIKLFNVDLKWNIEKGKESLWSHSLNLQNVENAYIEQLYLQPNPINSKLELVKLDRANNIEFGKVHYFEKFNESMVKQSTSKKVKF